METKIRVLVADANHDFCTLIKNLISAESDMEVVGATDDGLETLALVAELTPDVLIMDLALTKLDGLEVLRRIPESGAHPHVIVLSGFLNNNVVSACSSRGKRISSSSGGVSNCEQSVRSSSAVSRAKRRFMRGPPRR